jgi:tetraacyldisaccharide-1-P 4'-kinase
MTEKDAVKVSHLKNLDGWYLEVSAELPVEFETALLNKLEQITYTVESDG